MESGELRLWTKKGKRSLKKIKRCMKVNLILDVINPGLARKWMKTLNFFAENWN